MRRAPSWSVGEAAAVVVGRRAEVADERAAHRLGGAEADARGDGGDGVVGLLELAAGRLDAGGGDVAGRRHADLGGEAAQEVALAHRHPAAPARPSGGRRPGRRRSGPGPGAPARRAPVGATPARRTGSASPGRRRNITSQRATVSATSTPWSSSTRASATSMPAVTPADVHTSPSRIQIGSASTSTAGCSAGEPPGPGPVRRRPPAVEQARRRRAGTRRCRRRRRAGRAAASVGDRGDQRRRRPRAARTPTPPGTISVSTGRAGSSGVGDELQAALGAHRARRRRRRPRRRSRRAPARRRARRRRRRRPRAGR